MLGLWHYLFCLFQMAWSPPGSVIEVMFEVPEVMILLGRTRIVEVGLLALVIDYLEGN